MRLNRVIESSGPQSRAPGSRPTALPCLFPECDRSVPFGKRKFCHEHSGAEASKNWKRAHRAIYALTGQPYWLDAWLNKTPNEIAARSAAAAYMREYRARRRATMAAATAAR